MSLKYISVAAYILLISLVISSCSSTNLLTLSVTQPAPVHISSDIKSIGIIDRSLPEKKNEPMDDIDKILSVEGKNLDREGAHQAVVGLMDELNMNNRFSEVKLIESDNLRNPGFGVFPVLLSWEKIENICNKNNVDALFVLSFYDTDAKIEYEAIPVEIIGPMGVKIPVIEHKATVFTLIKAGWRIYDLKNKSIPDEFMVHEQVVSTGKGINPMKAVEAIIGRKEAVKQVSNEMGHRYGLRIVPHDIRVSRQYYVRGTDHFKIAKRRAQTGDWVGAAELWEKELENPKPKIAGRACYNMGIINEINGDLYAAVDWTAKSYVDYKNKKALDYLNVLKARIAENQRLQQQIE